MDRQIGNIHKIMVYIHIFINLLFIICILKSIQSLVLCISSDLPKEEHWTLIFSTACSPYVARGKPSTGHFLRGYEPSFWPYAKQVTCWFFCFLFFFGPRTGYLTWAKLVLFYWIWQYIMSSWELGSPLWDHWLN